MGWIRYWVGKTLPPQRLTVDDLNRGARIKWGWRAAEIRDETSNVVAQVPPPSKPGYVGLFPIERPGR